MARHAGAGSRSSRWSSLAVLGPVRRCALLLRGGLCCAWCGVELTRETAEIDHVVPRRDGGRDDNGNLVGACSACNLDRPEGWTWPAELELPIDRRAGRALALRWYQWLPARDAAQRAGRERRRLRALVAHAEAVAAGLGGDAFPFGEAWP
jgi:hypothetical protein